MCVPRRWVPDLQIRLPTENGRCSDADCRSELSYEQLRFDTFSFARTSTLPSYSASCACWGGVTLPLAPREGRERLEMAGTSERGACIQSRVELLSMM